MNLCSLLLVFLLSFSSGNTTYIANGKASYYADRMQGQRTASGERYDKTQLTAAHSSLPFNTLVEVTNQANGKSVIVKINDRMPKGSRIIDLSRAAAREIDMIRAGVGVVTIKEVIPEEKQQAVPFVVSEAKTDNSK
ncbi:septal ring lytic transglycosylase RlpA family protein [Pontibacter sp. BT310]|uniref:Probable endolytic peptidoglycan transglycosylase RlpA n=1 Tax=Pontibacter populi TaxID=890055 RepID=A0ABS6XA96_9BACT|nr:MULTISPECIES: septal ring lytic transglycosylase RlpA family protein [Pontibacter]MBJ6118074.1 septal ring lytic transglycosylase RlpA family protein [Pontibacter sp. BT310]MBR0570501.1 septal ring lytic transglycosylase RlpA family protein [Microvirga sp. STS03]MBW3364927.1 septal ring lytic transglycosylase RlpA family protein [Pontibacter populi]